MFGIKFDSAEVVLTTAKTIAVVIVNSFPRKAPAICDRNQFIYSTHFVRILIRRITGTTFTTGDGGQQN